MPPKNRVRGNGNKNGRQPPAIACAEPPQAGLSGGGPLEDRRLYINRELSLLAFQRRVLEEAQNESNPLLERFKFLSIVGSNLEEFFMVRVANLKRQVEEGDIGMGPDSLKPSEQLKVVHAEVQAIQKDAYDLIQKRLLPGLRAARICLVAYADLSKAEKAAIKQYFLDNIFPVLTPLAFDPGHPFPHISNLSLNLAILIRDNKGQERFARVKIPDTLPQLISTNALTGKDMRTKGTEERYIWLDEVIGANLDALFPGMQVLESHPFHVTRDAELEIQEWEASDLLEITEEGIRQRRFGDVVRLMVTDDMPEPLLDILTENLEILPAEVYMVEGRIPLSSLKHLCALNRPDLKDPPFIPLLPEILNPDSQEGDVFSVIKRRDVLLHHPFDSFQPVISFLQQAARDPNVLAIKMTLYRVGKNAPVVEALLDAMRQGKQVAVLVELKARFDEESNIEWAKALEREGVHVVYGLVGLKIHSKVALVVRREGDTIRRYVHLGTGNYNLVTAHLYTDLGLFTCDEEIGSDVTDLFNFLTGYSAKKDYRKLLVAPINLRSRFEALIAREIEHHRQGRSGHLIFKMNALVDDKIIRLLYQASCAGVKIDLIVRGMCCLRPGIAGVSENISVVSIVGRFLEHSRIYYFRNGGEEEVYMGSADLMPRNLNRRVEVLFPVENKRLRRFLVEDILHVYMSDNVKARTMRPDGSYEFRRPAAGQEAVSAQDLLISRQKVEKRPRKKK